MCQYQEGHCVQASLSIVVRVSLAWLSPLYQEKSTAEREETALSVHSVSYFSVSLSRVSLGASLGVSAEPSQNTNRYNTIFLSAILITAVHSDITFVYKTEGS